MSARKVSRGQTKRKRRVPEVLTRLEVRRGRRLCLRIIAAPDAIAEAADELGALIRKLAPASSAAPGGPHGEDFTISDAHGDGDDAYHARLREHLAVLFNSLCDTALSDALQIVREISARRAEGVN